MKAVDKNDKEAKRDREIARNKKEYGWYGNPIYLSQNSHKKSNKRK